MAFRVGCGILPNDSSNADRQHGKALTLTQGRQLSLFDDQTTNRAVKQATGQYYSGRELGTFKDSLRSPIHRWFRYPAGYSFKFVSESFDQFGVVPGNWVYDPFSGTGTTLVCAKQQGIHAYGVEAHSFVHWVAEVKLYWEFNVELLGREIEELISKIRTRIMRQLGTASIEGVFPALVYKCYHPHDLKVLYLIREFILNEIEDIHTANLFQLALTDTLRGAAAAGTGWPYISPRQNNGDKPPKNALMVFESTVRQMFADLCTITPGSALCEIRNILGDSRQKQDLADGQVTLALTSPPYLNNYDYADRTRLETYFWGITHSWEDITRQFRDKLIVAATTQVVRRHHPLETAVSQEIHQIAPDVYQTVQQAVLELTHLRPQKGGKKDYDLVVALYFNDMVQVIKETHRVLAPGGHFCLVLGDSAPYGVHVQTDEIIGQLGLGIGFSSFVYHALRTRGDKWKENPQRHRVPLREGVVILTK